RPHSPPSAYFYLTAPPPTPIYTLSLHDALPIFRGASAFCPQPAHRTWAGPRVLTPRYPQLLMIKAAGDFEGYLSFGIGLAARGRSEEHTSELQSRSDLVCRLLLEKKNLDPMSDT